MRCPPYLGAAPPAWRGAALPAKRPCFTTRRARGCVACGDAHPPSRGEAEQPARPCCGARDASGCAAREAVLCCSST
uniref:Uncharacterized protein n=1 Tax=Arundo donax TaxID=35708 RepID=A0A0A9TPA7_ARUDO